MKFSVPRETLLKPLNLVTGVVERRQTLPILANVLLELENNQLSLTGTDLEVEMVGRIELDDASAESGSVTVPARKFLDICKSLPDGSVIELTVNENRAVVKSGRSRFTLSTLPANEFPNVDESESLASISVLQGQLKRLIERTGFAMAQQDVRYYLNGMLWELSPEGMKTVSTDGHRLALCSLPSEFNVDERKQVIVPRKGILELSRLLLVDDEAIDIAIGSNHIRAITTDFTFTSKLVDGKFPDYERVLPKGGNKFVFADRQELKQALSRSAILSNEKYRGIRFMLESGNLKVLANNPEQEEAEENIAVEYQGESLEIGFNVSYLIDVMGVLSGENVKITLSDANSSALLEESEDSDSVYVVMPMRL